MSQLDKKSSEHAIPWRKMKKLKTDVMLLTVATMKKP